MPLPVHLRLILVTAMSALCNTSVAALWHLACKKQSPRLRLLRQQCGNEAAGMAPLHCHTPDALENVLKTIQAIRQKHQQIITVVGCGGDRDKEKRPKMAAIAAARSQQVVLTSDNPRTEDPQQIIADMEAGLDAAAAGRTLAVLDRKQAIKTALLLANPGDILLIAGKGHETYQEINGVRTDFDDVAVTKALFNQLDK